MKPRLEVRSNPASEVKFENTVSRGDAEKYKLKKQKGFCFTLRASALRRERLFSGEKWLAVTAPLPRAFLLSRNPGD